jgi:hypothetical protein
MIKTSDLSSRATNGSPGGSDSALSVPAVGAAFAGADEKELSKVAKRFLIAEINRLAEENQQLKALQEKYHNLDKKMVVGLHPTGTFHPIWGFARPSTGTVRIALLAVAVGACAGAISNFDAAIFNKGTAIIPTKPSSVPTSAHPDAVKPPSFSEEPKIAADTDPTMGVQTEVVKTESFSAGSKTQNTLTSFDNNNLAKQPEALTSIDGQMSSNLAPAAAQQGQRDYPISGPPDSAWASLVRYIFFGQESKRPIPRQTKVAGSGGGASSRSSRINADPDHASNQKRTGKHRTGKVEIAAGTIWQAPPHAGKHVKLLGDVSEHHDR